MNDLYGHNPYTAFTQLIPQSNNTNTGADPSTIQGNIAVGNQNGVSTTYNVGSTSAADILNFSLKGVTHLGKNTNKFFLQSDHIERTGCALTVAYSEIPSSTTTQYCAAMEYRILYLDNMQGNSFICKLLVNYYINFIQIMLNHH